MNANNEFKVVAHIHAKKSRIQQKQNKQTINKNFRF